MINPFIDVIIITIDQNLQGKMIKINKSKPINILKIRLAKGEITKEEYEEMRRMIES